MVLLLQLSNKVIQKDCWQEERFSQMMTQLHQELVEKEESLVMLQVVV